MSQLQEQLIGTWALVSYQDEDDNYYYLPESVICKRLIEILKP